MKLTEEQQQAAIKKRAISMGAVVLGGSGKLAFFIDLITQSLGQPCPYCGDKLTLKKMNLDHKEPMERRLMKDRANTVEERKYADRRENLQIVCKTCNATKSDMTDEEFRRLLAFLEQDPDLKAKVLRRLRQSATVWKMSAIARGRKTRDAAAS